MNFQISKKEFIDNLTIICKAVSSTTPLPILAGVKIVCKNNQIELLSSDSNISINTVITNENNCLKINEDGEIVVDAKYLQEIIRKIDSEYINFEIIDGTLIKIYGGTSEFKINGINANEYPNISFEIKSETFKLNTEIFNEIVNETAFACSDKETRPVLTGVNFKCLNNELIVNATDSYRLAYKKINLEQDLNFDITIPAKYLIEISRTINSEEVEIAIDPQQIFFKFGNTIIKTRLLDDAFPDTTKLIPLSFTQVLKVDSREMINQLDRTSFIKSDGKSIVKMKISSDVVEMTSSDNLSSYYGTMSVIGFEGEPFEISCSCKYLQDAIKSLGSDVVVISFSGELKPMILKADNNDSLIQLISPVRTYR